VEKCRVYVVDDDPTVRRSIAFLLASNELDCFPFASGEELLDEHDDLDPGCILLDVILPNRSGLEVQVELARRGSKLPVIAMTGGANMAAATEALTLGAISVLEKPFPEEALLEALQLGFDRIGIRTNGLPRPAH
jgi:two-component system, LuxR family, response regulator FixJ